MYSNKFIQILGQLDRKEVTRFCELVHSPYFNKHRQVQQLVTYLSGVFPDLSPKNCSRQHLLTTLWPGGEVDEAKLAVLFTYSWRLLQTFFVAEGIREGGVSHQLYQLRFLRERRHHKIYEKKWNRLAKEVQEWPLRDSEWYFSKYLLAEEADEFYGQQSRHREDENIQRKQEFLELYYLSVKLRDACEMKARSRILNVAYEPGNLSRLLEELGSRQEYYREHPAVWAYYQLYKMLDTRDDAFFWKVKEDVTHWSGIFKKEELLNIFNYLLNYCVERINQGGVGFLRALLDLYQVQLEREILMENGYLLEWHYKNIVTTALRLGETQWTDHFIETYKSYLLPECLPTAYAYNKAAWHYEMEQYDQVLELLLKVEYRDIRYVQGVKAILLRTYYDLEEYEPFLSLADSFTQLLQRNKTLSEGRKRGFANLIRFARRAFHLKMEMPFWSAEKTDREIRKLKLEIEDTDNIFNRSWLLERVGQLQPVD